MRPYDILLILVGIFCGHTLRFCDGKMLMLVTVTF
jgi:hypothetical protein